MGLWKNMRRLVVNDRALVHDGLRDIQAAGAPSALPIHQGAGAP